MAKISREFMVDLVKQIAGSDVIPLVDSIKDKENVSEFKIAEKLKLTVNQVRNMLYRLAEHNLVSSTRKKDKKKGWYIYYWTFDQRKAIQLLRKMKQDRLTQLKKTLKTLQEVNFFVCKDCTLRYTYEQALDLTFLCANCAQPLQAEDSHSRSRIMQKEIAQLEAELVHKDLQEPIIVVEEPVVVKKKAKKEEKKAPAPKKSGKKKQDKNLKKLQKLAKKSKTTKKRMKPSKKKSKPAKKKAPAPVKKKGFMKRLFKR